MNIRQKEFSTWLHSERGFELIETERRYLHKLLENIYGYHGLLLADPSQSELAGVMKVDDYAFIHPSQPEIKKGFISAKYSALPIQSDSMQVVLMPHTLEFVSNPHLVLREVERVMRPEGHAIIVGFNPFSWCGLFRLFSNSGVWTGQFRSMRRVNDWLTLLGFDVLKYSYHKFLPAQKDLDVIEDVGKKICPFFAGIYIIIAKKQMLGMTPQRLAQKRQTKFIKKSVAKPASRDMCD